MRILFVSEYFHPRPAGGEVWAFSLMRGLAQRGHEVKVLCDAHEKRLSRHQVIDGVEIVRLGYHSMSVPGRIGFICRLRRALKKESYDVLHGMAYLAGFVAYRHDKKAIVSVHSYFGEDWSYLQGGWWKRRLESFLLPDGMRIHVPSAFTRNLLGRGTVIENWVDPPAKRDMKREGDIVVSSLEPIKRVERIIARQPDDRLLRIVGDGSQRKKLERLAKGKNIVFLGNLSREDTYDLIASSERLIMDSMNESYSFVIIEALMLGTPVESSRVGIVSSLVERIEDKQSMIDLDEGRVFIRVQKKLPIPSRDECIDAFEALYGEGK